MKASAVSGKNGRDSGGKAEDCVLIEMVSWVVAASPEGVTVSWSKEHVAPLGRPEHAKVTGELNPFSGVTVSISAAWPPEFTVSEGSEALSTKLGCKVMVKAADATALLVSPESTAIASRVSVELTAMGPVYRLEDVVGVVPLVV